MTSTPQAQEQVKEYYSEVLKSSEDLQTNACCFPDDIPQHIKTILKTINSEVLERFYGCGSPIPEVLEGCTVVDLGCGTGRDSFVMAKLVGESGKVIGVDMTAEQLEVAQRNEASQAKAFGYAKPNTRFVQGYIEDLKSLGLEDNSVDLVISNCVINLSPKKEDVFKEIFRVLKPGGELYFSDVFSDRRIPAELFNDPVLLGECLSGALYTHDFRRMLARLGCPDYREVNSRPLSIGNSQIEERIGMINFSSTTVRAFKLGLEDICEDYGQIAIYKGTIPYHPHQFSLDDHHTFETKRPMLVCGNTADMLQHTRYSKHFDIIGDKSTHFGEFDCSEPASNPTSFAEESQGDCCSSTSCC